MHLMLGLGFIVGVIKYPEQTFNITATKEVGTLLLLAVMSIVIPALFHAWSGTGGSLVRQSRGTAFILIATYAIFLYSQIWSHIPIFEGEAVLGKEDPEREGAADIETEEQTVLQDAQMVRRARELHHHALTIRRSPNPPRAVTTFITLVIATALIGFHTTFATDNLSSMTEANLSRGFIGIVILPLLSNDIGPIKAAWQNHMDKCLASTVGKCVQTALLVIPLIISIAWGMGDDAMSLRFDEYEVANLFMSALYVNFVISNGKCN